MNCSETMRSGMMMSLLMLGAWGYAASEPLSTNAAASLHAGTASPNAVAMPHSTNTLVIHHSTNGAAAAAGVTNKPVVHAATNTVPVHHAPQIVAVEAAPEIEEEGASWVDRIPVGVEEGDDWWRNRIEIGTRITSFQLAEKESPPGKNYLGSINMLKEEQDYTPTKLYANAWVLEWLGVGLSYEKLGEKTWTDNGEPGSVPYTDGTFNVGGPILSALVAWPNQSRFTPFAEVGQWFMSGSVDLNPAWANAHGIDGYQEFEITKYKGGMVWGGGCAIQLTRNIEMDLIYRQIKASILVDHILLGSVAHADSEFPLDSSWMGAGVKYRF